MVEGAALLKPARKLHFGVKLAIINGGKGPLNFHARTG